MARPLRIHAPGTAVHVVSRGNDKRPIFLDAVDYEQYLQLLAKGLRRFGIVCHAYCLLWNHLHLLLTPDLHPIWRLMQQVNSAYCEWSNARHHHVGHVLQGRPFCKLCDDGSYFLNLIRYLALNPVMAGKVKRPEDWPWSSYRALMGLEPLPEFLDVGLVFHTLDADDEQEMRIRLRAFVDAGADADVDDHNLGSLVTGSPTFVKQMDALVAPFRGVSEYSYEHRYATRPSLASLLRAAEGAVLEDALVSAFLKHGYTLKEIVQVLGGGHPSTLWRRIQGRANQPRG